MRRAPPLSLSGTLNKCVEPLPASLPVSDILLLTHRALQRALVIEVHDRSNRGENDSSRSIPIMAHPFRRISRGGT